MARLASCYGSLPSDPDEQNRLFYKVYRAHANEVGVLDAQKSYLAARDIGIINLILFLLLPSFAWWATGNREEVVTYAAPLFVSYLVMAITAQVYARRFFENVLAAASTGKP